MKNAQREQSTQFHAMFLQSTNVKYCFTSFCRDFYKLFEYKIFLTFR